MPENTTVGTQPLWSDTLLVSQTPASSLSRIPLALWEILGGRQVMHKMQRQAIFPLDRAAAAQIPLLARAEDEQQQDEESIFSQR